MLEYERLAAARYWQEQASQGKYQPLRCPNDGKHRPLDPDVNEEGCAVLVCVDCGYVQNRIPEPVVRIWRQANRLDQRG